jgi:hypothetical protein
VSSSVIKKSVLSSIHPTSVEGSLVSCQQHRHSLPIHSPRLRWRSSILQAGESQSYQLRSLNNKRQSSLLFKFISNLSFSFKNPGQHTIQEDLILTTNPMPLATKLGAQTVNVALSAVPLLLAVWELTIVVAVTPAPCNEMNGLLYGMITFSLHHPTVQQ